MAQPKPVAEATLDMIEIMTRAFDESEGGEGGGGTCPPGSGTCAFKDPDGYVICNLSKGAALFFWDPYGSGSGANWCCDSCPKAQWWIEICGGGGDM